MPHLLSLHSWPGEKTSFWTRRHQPGMDTKFVDYAHKTCHDRFLKSPEKKTCGYIKTVSNSALSSPFGQIARHRIQPALVGFIAALPFDLWRCPCICICKSFDSVLCVHRYMLICFYRLRMVPLLPQCHGFQHVNPSDLQAVCLFFLPEPHSLPRCHGVMAARGTKFCVGFSLAYPNLRIWSWIHQKDDGMSWGTGMKVGFCGFRNLLKQFWCIAEIVRSNNPKAIEAPEAECPNVFPYQENINPHTPTAVVKLHDHDHS